MRSQKCVGLPLVSTEYHGTCKTGPDQLGTAIRVAQEYRIDLNYEHCQHLSEHEYSRWREVWLSIIVLDGLVMYTISSHPLISAGGLLLALAERLRLTRTLLGILSYGYACLI